MRDTKQIAVKVVFWAVAFNPGTILVGLSLYSLTVPENTLLELWGGPLVSYLLLALGLTMIAVTGWRVFTQNKG